MGEQEIHLLWKLLKPKLLDKKADIFHLMKIKLFSTH